MEHELLHIRLIQISKDRKLKCHGSLFSVYLGQLHKFHIISVIPDHREDLGHGIRTVRTGKAYSHTGSIFRNRNISDQRVKETFVPIIEKTVLVHAAGLHDLADDSQIPCLLRFGDFLRKTGKDLLLTVRAIDSEITGYILRFSHAICTVEPLHKKSADPGIDCIDLFSDFFKGHTDLLVSSIMLWSAS